jgi:hypothetical protein
MHSGAFAWCVETVDSSPQYGQTNWLFGDPGFVTVALDEVWSAFGSGRAASRILEHVNG